MNSQKDSDTYQTCRYDMKKFLIKNDLSCVDELFCTKTKLGWIAHHNKYESDFADNGYLFDTKQAAENERLIKINAKISKLELEIFNLNKLKY